LDLVSGNAAISLAEIRRLSLRGPNLSHFHIVDARFQATAILETSWGVKSPTENKLLRCCTATSEIGAGGWLILVLTTNNQMVIVSPWQGSLIASSRYLSSGHNSAQKG
jgi:hypothetical protein